MSSPECTNPFQLQIIGQGLKKGCVDNISRNIREDHRRPLPYSPISRWAGANQGGKKPRKSSTNLWADLEKSRARSLFTPVSKTTPRVLI